MHKHYIYRSTDLVAVISGDCLIDMLDAITELIVEDISAQNNFSDFPVVKLSKLPESDEAVFVGSTSTDSYTYIVKSTWQAKCKK